MPANYNTATGRRRWPGWSRRCRSWLRLSIHVSRPDPWLTFKQGGLNNTKQVTTGEANGVGELLMRSGYFSDDRATSVCVGQEEGAYQLKFVINLSRVADPKVRVLNIVI
jgi:hypothetical protein